MLKICIFLFILKRKKFQNVGFGTLLLLISDTDFISSVQIPALHRRRRSRSVEQFFVVNYKCILLCFED